MNATNPLLPPVCVVGLGLIGGSLLRAASGLTTGSNTTDSTPAFGWSRTASTRDVARADGYDVVDTLVDALHRAEDADALVVLAVPVTAIEPVLRTIDECAPAVRLTDVASVKTTVADAVAALAAQARYVGSHPMAGTEQSGWAAGRADLFRGAAWVTCLDEHTPIGDWVPLARLAMALGSRVVPAEAEAHDDAVARISHLPHVLALALAQVGEAGGALPLSLAASSFADGTRVAGTRPELIRAMCEANRTALVGALDEALGLIGVARASLSSTGSLQRLTDAGHQARQQFDDRTSGMQSAQLSGSDLVDQLLAVGASGGWVSAIDGPDNNPMITVNIPADLQGADDISPPE